MLGHVVRDVFTVSCRGACSGVGGRLTVSLSPQASIISAHTVST